MIDTKLILKNTFALYIRAVISLFVSLYTTRIVLNNLGIENWGVFQVVGGVVLIFSFLNISLSNATQRYISYYIGLGKINDLKRLFSMTINVHLFISILIISLIEVFGIWYIKFEAEIGNATLEDVYLVLHFTTIGLFFNIMSVPYRAFLISKEKMKLFAFIDILSVFLKMIFAASLILFSDNRLIIYASLLMLSSLIVALVYKFVCNKEISESFYSFKWDNNLFKELLSFTGWTTIPSISSVMKGQGTVLILNSFFGPVLNAAQGVANQVKSGIKTFSLNLLAAFSPQITITYAEKDFESMEKLVIGGSKLTFYIFLFICVPILTERNYILSVWLVEVPDYASTLVLLVLIDTMISLMSSTFNLAIRATGKIKNYELTVNFLHLLGLPISLLFLKFNFGYETVFIVWIMLSATALLVESFWLNKLLPFIKIKLLTYTILVMLIVAFLSLLPPVLVAYYLESGFWRFILVGLISIISVTSFSFIVGLNMEEKKIAINYISKIKSKFL